MTKNSTVVKNEPVMFSDSAKKNGLRDVDDVVKNNTIDGLIIKGSVSGRLRRFVGDKNTELITYKIAAGGSIYFIKDWAPKDYFPVGKSVELPITIKSYLANGIVRTDYTIRNNSFLGEEF